MIIGVTWGLVTVVNAVEPVTGAVVIVIIGDVTWGLVTVVNAVEPVTGPVVVVIIGDVIWGLVAVCLLYTSPSPRDGLLSRMPSSA